VTRVAVRLPLTFDAARLAADLAIARSVTPWETHFNPQYHDGGWSGIALRTNSTHILQLYIDPSRLDRFVDTPALGACSYFASVLAAFPTQVRAARLMRLEAGAVIREHRDADVDLERGEEVRVHVPVVTNSDVEFLVNGERVTLLPGECWILNLGLPHSVANRGATDRVHLVIDMVANEWVRAAL
jgi:hypothetical protein